VHEIIVVDDGSPDDVADVVARTYGDQVILLCKPNGGAASARNMGIDRATGDFVAFLDADDYWEPEKLARQLALFAEHPQLGLVAGRWYHESPEGARDVGDTPPEHWSDRVLDARGPEAFWVATMVWTGTVLVRREVLGAERFVSGLEPAEDRDLWVRLVTRAPAWLMSQPLATAVMEPESLSRTNPDRDCGNLMRVIERNRDVLGFWATRQWMAHTYYRWSIGGASLPTALARMVRSLLVWPLPFTALEEYPVRTLPRLQRLAVLTVALSGLRRW
jgi:glycosyltransferase involved in cell wall biosynthesis